MYIEKPIIPKNIAYTIKTETTLGSFMLTSFLTYGLKEAEIIKAKYPVIGDVRGLGLMVATEFTSDGKPDKETAKSVQKACLDRNLLLLTCGTFENVIRWIPPLIVSGEQIAGAISIFDQALTEVVKQ